MAVNRGLNVVALISGGKDSLFSILHCIAQGHTVVAIANLHPKDVQSDATGQELENEVDVDSFLYQTVGHSVIPQYALALGLPLYRRPIIGTAVDQSLFYTPSGTLTKDFERDETEDLFLLLGDVLVAHPHVNAVSCGAILSTYQRMRVESVAIRLDLVPLAPLWQFPYLPPYGDEVLLNDMGSVGQHAMIIKVASGGLDTWFLGKNVADFRTVSRLKAKMDRFGRGVGALIGEGGEFETLTIQGPPQLWKKRLVFERQTIVSGQGGSAALHLFGAKTQDLDDDADLTIKHPRIPPDLDEEFLHVLEQWILDEYINKPNVMPFAKVDLATVWKPWVPTTLSRVEFVMAKSGHVVRYSNVFGFGETAQAQMQQIAKWLQNTLESFEHPPAVLNTLLILRDMKDFASVNAAYGAVFTTSLPPSRVTICCGNGLVQGKDVVMSVTLDCRPNQNRQGIHVQSRSYWAPANIGPYSQAILEPCELLGVEKHLSETPALVHMAGQIPLVPASMELPVNFDNLGLTKQPSPLLFQTALALQHLWRVGRVVNVSQWTGGLVYLANGDLGEAESMAMQAIRFWRNLVESIYNEWLASFGDDEPISPAKVGGEDAWKLSEPNQWNKFLENYKDSPIDLEKDAHDRLWLPNYSTVVSPGTRDQKLHLRPCFAVLVSDLPRASPVEWWSLGFGSTKVVQSRESLLDGAIFVHRTTSVSSGVVVSWIAVQNVHNLLEIEQLAEFRWSFGRQVQPICTCYLSKALEGTKVPIWNPTIVPCRAIWSESGRIDALVVVTYYPDSDSDSHSSS